MKTTHLLYALLLLTACLSCTSEGKEINTYEKLSVEIISESSKIAFSPNLEEVLCIIPNNRADYFGDAWAYLYNRSDLSLIDSCFVMDNFILSWDNDTIGIENIIIEDEMINRIDASKNSLSNYSIEYVLDNNAPQRAFVSWWPSTITFTSYEIDIAKDELLFFEKETKDTIRLSFKEYSNDLWEREKTLEMNGMLKKVKYKEYYFFKRHSSYIKPSNFRLLEAFYEDLFKAVSGFEEEE